MLAVVAAADYDDCNHCHSDPLDLAFAEAVGSEQEQVLGLAPEQAWSK